MADKLDTVIGACIAGVVGIILICSMAIPIAVQQIGNIGSVTGITLAEKTAWTSMVEVVVLMLLVGLIIAIIRHFNGSGSR